MTVVSPCRRGRARWKAAKGDLVTGARSDEWPQPVKSSEATWTDLAGLSIGLCGRRATSEWSASADCYRNKCFSCHGRGNCKPRQRLPSISRYPRQAITLTHCYSFVALTCATSKFKLKCSYSSYYVYLRSDCLFE